ncbi:SDR family oxidoreductase [Nocardia crassostreae]|uniref:SDR family oxidoreductase n=1 Tax=Nocardia crassostreae TaxID=53428 RepID=UPI000830CB69|nr:SDR family oxidoreductase [Nocardia crassostreae]
MSTRTIFITGAAAGIGRAIAARFAAGGWIVGLYDIDHEAVTTTAASLGPLARTVTGSFDVTDPAGWQTALAEFVSAAGKLDVLVNNAGILVSGAFTEVALAQQHRVIDVNVKGVINGCYCALPYLRENPGSQIVNLASASALYGQPALATYAASKAAVRSLTEALDLEWRGLGIAVHDVLPLFVSTAMMDEVGKGSKTAETLGVRLIPTDVAEAVWRTVHRKRLLEDPHVLVGWQTTVLNAAMSAAPTWLNRLVAGRLSHADEIGARHRGSLVDVSHPPTAQ